MSEKEGPNFTYNDLTHKNPCEGCPAPCCRMQINPCIPPADLMSIDHIRYTLLFPNTELTISKTGEFSYVRWETCSLFAENSCTCKLHNTQDKPLTCRHYNPHNCWYKRNFVGNEPADLCRLNIEHFEMWMTKVEFDADNKVVGAPSFEQAQEIARAFPVSPAFHANLTLVKNQDLMAQGQ